MVQSPLENLSRLLARLPGLGPKSARRIIFHLLANKHSVLNPLHHCLSDAATQIVTCQSCRNFDIQTPCRLCQNPERQAARTICIVESVSDLWALDQAGLHKGLYFVLGGVLNALDGIGPQDLGIDQLLAQVDTTQPEEIILATNATVEGQTTAHYLIHQLKDKNITISQLAHGLPMGGELDYLDQGTLNAAMLARHQLDRNAS